MIRSVPPDAVHTLFAVAIHPMESKPFCMKLPESAVNALRTHAKREANSAAAVARRLVMQGLERLAAEEVG